jgi:hypothetical protein
VGPELHVLVAHVLDGHPFVLEFIQDAAHLTLVEGPA